MEVQTLFIMTANDLANRAVEFANNLIEGLEGVNTTWATATLSEPEREALPYNLEAILISPKKFRPEFEAWFCSYIATRYILVPD